MNKFITFERQIPNSPEQNINPLGFVNWGRMNDFPNFLSNLYYTSSTHKSCIDFLVTCMTGIDGENDPNELDSWNDLMTKVSLDLCIYGGYAIQIIKNKDNKTYSFYHQPFSQVRQIDGEQINSYMICEDWTNTSKYKPFKIDRFDDRVKIGQPYLYYYKRYTPDSKFYPLPHYYGAIKAIQTESELLRYDLKSVLNNFSANGVVCLDRIEDEKERKKAIDGIQKMFQGSENSNTVMITFKNNSNDTPVTFTPFDKDISNVNLFNDNNDRTINRILSSHRIANPTLIGLPNGGTGFANEGELLRTSYNLLKITIIDKFRTEVMQCLNRLAELNGYTLNINEFTL